MDAPLRRSLLPVLLVASTVGFVAWVSRSYPVHQWLFWRYAGYWLAALVFAFACFALGHFVLTRLLHRQLRALEQIVVAFSLGMFGYELLVFVAGLLRLYHWLLFFALPGAIIIACGKPAWRYLACCVRNFGAHRRRLAALPVWLYVVVGLGVLGLLMIYLPTLTPQNAQFDARWKHLGLAEEYIARGGVERLIEGRTFAARPNFTSYLYVWAFLLPGARLFDQIELSAHIEVVVFLVTTLIGIPALTRRLIPRANPAIVWIVRLAFPGVYLYDSSLAIGADHIGALYTVPVFLFAVRFLRRPSVSDGMILGVLLAGAALVKYTIALMLVPGVVVLVLAGVLLPAWRARRAGGESDSSRWYRAPLAVAAAALIFSAPHWLKNLIWYGNPVYPLLGDLFWSHPWTENASYVFEWGYRQFQPWQPQRNLIGFLRTLAALWDFSFTPNDWGKFHRDVPVFGSLFTFLVLCAPLLRPTRRLWLLLGWIYGDIFIWYWVNHQDRYLQAIMPLIAAATAALMIGVWRSGRRPTRAALIGLVVIQIIWGADVFFIPTHPFIGAAPVVGVAELIGKGYAGEYEERFAVQEYFVSLGEELREDGEKHVVLMHENHNSLGLAMPQISDWQTWQYGLDYSQLQTPRQMYDRLEEYGVTHIHWRSGRSSSFDTVAADIIFLWFAEKYGTARRKRENRFVVRMPADPPDVMERFPEEIVVAACGDGYQSGVYELTDLTVPSFGPKSEHYPPPRRVMRERHELGGMLESVDVLVLGVGCSGYPTVLRRAFVPVATRKEIHKLELPRYTILFRRGE